jgi:hypothetical protein
MLTSLTLAAYLAAPSVPPPVPAAAPPVVAAPAPVVRSAIAPATVPAAAPRVLDLKPENGKILVPVTRPTKEKIQMGIAIGAPGGAPQKPIEREITVPKEVKVDLSEVKDLTVTTADGKAVDTKDALKRLAEGGRSSSRRTASRSTRSSSRCCGTTRSCSCPRNSRCPRPAARAGATAA